MPKVFMVYAVCTYIKTVDLTTSGSNFSIAVEITDVCNLLCAKTSLNDADFSAHLREFYNS